jgi:hypothetical protein
VINGELEILRAGTQHGMKMHGGSKFALVTKAAAPTRPTISGKRTAVDGTLEAFPEVHPLKETTQPCRIRTRIPAP